jgi:hypothetical protein
MLTCDQCGQPARACVSLWIEDDWGDGGYGIKHACARHLLTTWHDHQRYVIFMNGYDRITEHHVCGRMDPIRESDGWTIGEYDEESGHLYLYRWEPFYENGRFAGVREPHHGRERRFPIPLPGLFAANR